MVGLIVGLLHEIYRLIFFNEAALALLRALQPIEGIEDRSSGGPLSGTSVQAAAAAALRASPLMLLLYVLPGAIAVLFIPKSGVFKAF
mmetsp:Transcript_357/g.1027  ORF Transcript_357/g.1027 Transcript_357/m.1027 type:complete len:88 (-) Transcript_357:376-639(-)